MASVTITDLLMLVAVLFILYFIINTITTKKTKEDFADVNLNSPRTDKIDKSCSQASINQNHLDYIFSSTRFVR